MKGYYEKELFVTPSLCDAASRLSLQSVFVLFQDAASEHAETLGIGGNVMAEKGLFWLTVRTKVRFLSRPRLMERLQLKTWLGEFAPGDLRTYRYYTLFCGVKAVAEGRTEWAILRVADHGMARIRDVGFPDVAVLPDTVLSEPFSRFRVELGEEVPTFRSVVRTTDVDMGQHMNNTAYIRALLDTFSVEELKEMDVRELEICFKQACYGGEALTIRRQRNEEGWLFVISRADGKPATMAQLRLA